MPRLVTCPDCAGLGSAVTKINRRRAGSVSSVTFDLKKPCATCAGTGKAFVNGHNLYVGRPDLPAPDDTTPAKGD